MALRKLEDLTVRVVNEDAENEAPNSEIMQHAAPTGKFVAGAILEAAIAWGEWRLLFLTNDIPFEDMLNIHLLDAQLNTVDSALIGGMYTTGSFGSLELIQPNSVAFSFIGDTTWRVELSEQPSLRLPFFSDPRGVYRERPFSRYFKIFGNPLPQAGH